MENSKNLQEPEIQKFISDRLLFLRKRLLDPTRRNPLINIPFKPNSTSIIRAVDELPDVLRYNLTNGTPMRLTPLPALQEELPDEATRDFLNALYLWRSKDDEYLKVISEINPIGNDDETKLLKAERTLKDKIREQLELPPRQTKETINLSLHAKNHGISPSYILPLPDTQHDDGRHHDNDIQTLMLPDRLQRVAKAVSEKGRSFERESGVNVLHAAFGILEWKDPDEKISFLSPLLLLEIKIERRQSRSGAEFYISALDKVRVNTTLAQKFLSEHRIELPDYEETGAEEYFKKIMLASPKGWHWKVKREVIFGIFPSSKIAMYHDLDPHKHNISKNEIVAKLMASSGSGDGSYAQVYETDDPEVSKKVPYLVLDADASQYSALVDISDGANLSIEGPPGSGKSQSIVNLIAAALADKKRVLFVAEKLSALDVVKNRLESVDLGEFILPLQAGKGTREKIYESIRSRLELRPNSSNPKNDFESKQINLARRREILQRYLDALSSKLGDSNMTVYDAIGFGISTNSALNDLPKNIRRIQLRNSENYKTQDIELIAKDAEAFAGRLDKIIKMPKLWLASEAQIMSRDDAEDLGETAKNLILALEKFHEDAQNSYVSNIIGETPLTTDFKNPIDLLREINKKNKVVDTRIVQELTKAENQKIVRKLCSDLQEFMSAKASLSRLIHSPHGEETRQRLEIACEFSQENNQQIAPAKHRSKINEYKNEIKGAEVLVAILNPLPKIWTNHQEAKITKIIDGAKVIGSFSEDVRSLRLFDKNLQAQSLASELLETQEILRKEIKKIQQRLPNAKDHDEQEIRDAAEVIRDAGALRFLSTSFRNACKTYTHTLGGGIKLSQSSMSQKLMEYHHWLQKKRHFENDSRFKAIFGKIFKGMKTEEDLVLESADFFACCQEISEGDQAIQRELETGSLSNILKVCDAEPISDFTLTELKTYLAEQKEFLETEESRLLEAQGHLGQFKECPVIDCDDVKKILSQNKRLVELETQIVNSKAAEILGDRFSGIETTWNTMQIECDLAEAINISNTPELGISILRSGKISEILEETEALNQTRDNIEKMSKDFYQKLKLKSEYCSASSLFQNRAMLTEAAANPVALLERSQLMRVENSLRSHGFDVLVNWAIEQGKDFFIHKLLVIVRAIIAKSMANRALELHSEALYGYDGSDFNKIRMEIAKTDRQLIEDSRQVVRDELISKAWPPQGNNFGKKSTFTDMSLILNEMSKKRNRIGVRDLTRRASSALLELKPCWMMSPLAVAQYLHRDISFDLIVIDEASQMTPENAIGALSRGKQAVIVGDTKQLPPTSFFQKMLDETDEDEDLQEDSESILDMANISFMPIRQFRWHYRSRHDSLIQFSNQMMYQGGLTIFPSPHKPHEDLGVQLVETRGTYTAGQNVTEAKAVVAATIKHMEEKPEFSLGICTMNAHQKMLIQEEFELERDQNKKVQAYIAKWEHDNDALEEFFIKNLETIQGDERDFIFISTLYGPEKVGGKVMQRFGPVNSSNGHRRLNVLFSRAKRKIVSFTSLKPTDILTEGARNKGVKMFRDWIEYSKTGHFVGPAPQGGETESPFEDFVAQQIKALGCEVVPQVGVAGFRIDLGLRHPEWPYGFLLGVECDGATYHSSRSSRDRDRLRQEVLEGLGWRLHRIWSTDWFRDPRQEIESLKKVIALALEEKKNSQINFNDDRQHKTIFEEKISLEVATENYVQNEPVEVKSESKELDQNYWNPESENQSKLDFELTAVSKIAEVGCKIKIQNMNRKDQNNKFRTFTLVKGKNDPENEELSINSPLGKALIDTQVGDEVEYQIGSEIQLVKILQVD